MTSLLLLQQCPECLVCLTWLVYDMGGKWLYSRCFVDAASRFCSKHHAASLCSFHAAFSPRALLKLRLCSYTIKLTQLQLERILVTFFLRNFISIIYVFQTIVLIFVAMFISMFRLLYALAFFRWLEYWT